MALGAIDNLGTSVKGMFTDGAGEKAVLYVYLADISKSATKEENDADFKKEMGDLNDLEKDIMKKAQNKASFKGSMQNGGASLVEGIKNTFKPGGKSADNIGELDTEHNKFVKIKVQYNPATIRLSSVSGKIQSLKGEEGIDRLSVYRFKGKSKISFDLIFDDEDNMNAFMLNDVVNSNFTGAANKGLNTLQHGGNNYSVRKKMDAMMSLLSSSHTQQVLFVWSNMCFRGSLTYVGNKFTMFNPEGHPIRGEMHLEITQNKQIEELKYDERYWQNAFKNCFKEKNAIENAGIAAANSSSSTMDKIFNNNFINLSL